jgi:hypothetical protein
MADLFDGEGARDARDEGMKRAMMGEGIWSAKAQRMALDAIPVGWVGLFEEIRRELTRRGLNQPHVYQCWSAFSNTLLRSGHFERDKEWDRPLGVASHRSSYRKMRRV